MVQAQSATRLARAPAHRRVVRLLLPLGVVALALVYELLFGKLFVYSPVLPGFSPRDLQHATFCMQSGAPPVDLQKIDALLPLVEEAHGLRFTTKPRLIIFRDDARYRRLSPSKARFCAFYNGTLVISPRALREAAEGKISLSTYLRHELSHVLLFQHMGPLQARRFPKWLLEGIATYTGGQMGTPFYPGREETYRLMRQGNYMPPEQFKTPEGDRLPLRVANRWPFVYCEFACLVDYLTTTGGEERFWRYVGALREGGRHEVAFREAYGMEFGTAVQGFREYVQGTPPGGGPAPAATK